MTTIALEGTGASIAFATSLFQQDLISLTLPEKVRASIDTTHLGTVGAKTSKPAKLIDIGEISCEVDHNARAIRLEKQAPEQITITYPVRDGETNPDQIVLTGYVTKVGGEEFKVDARLTSKLTIKVTGDFQFIQGS